MEAAIVKLRRWNERLNGLPRKGLLIALTLAACWIFVLIVPYCWPFLLGLLFSLLLRPLTNLLEKGRGRFHLPRALAAAIGMLLLFGIVGVLTVVLAGRLGREVVGLARSVPDFITWLTGTVVPWLQQLYAQYADILPPSALSVVNNALSALGDAAMKWAGNLSAAVTSGAVSTATSIPGALLSIVLTVMGTYYFTADRERIMGFLKRTFPASLHERAGLIRDNLFRSLFGQLKSQILVSLIITAFLVLAFGIYGVNYGLLVGLIIGVADALPVVGAGLFLIPWCLIAFVMGDVKLGIFVGLVYVGTIVIRQISEPRIVGKALGLYPLATMAAMYAGYVLLGFIGLLAGPVLLNLLRVVLEADALVRKKNALPE